MSYLCNDSEDTIFLSEYANDRSASAGAHVFPEAIPGAYGRCVYLYITSTQALSLDDINNPNPVIQPVIYITKGEPSSKFDEFLAGRSQFDSDHDQIWQACADRSGNGS